MAARRRSSTGQADRIIAGIRGMDISGQQQPVQPTEGEPVEPAA
jgi:hypothetical protein